MHHQTGVAVDAVHPQSTHTHSPAQHREKDFVLIVFVVFFREYSARSAGSPKDATLFYSVLVWCLPALCARECVCRFDAVGWFVGWLTGPLLTLFLKFIFQVPL